MLQKNLVFIKFGGSLITDKNKPYFANFSVIRELVKEIKEVCKKFKNISFVVGNGAGSFGHYAALTRNIHDPLGFAFVQQKVKELNSLVVAELLRQKVPAISIHFSSIATSSGGRLSSGFYTSTGSSIQSGIIPVFYGDIIFDSVEKSHIFSTEKIFLSLIEKFSKKGFNIDRVIYLTTVDGFLDKSRKIIPFVNKDNFGKVKKNLFKTKGLDVTGGMKHKIEESLKLAKKGVASYIANGRREHVLKQAISDKNFYGTVIR